MCGLNKKLVNNPAASDITNCNDNGEVMRNSLITTQYYISLHMLLKAMWITFKKVRTGTRKTVSNVKVLIICIKSVIWTFNMSQWLAIFVCLTWLGLLVCRATTIPHRLYTIYTILFFTFKAIVHSFCLPPWGILSNDNKTVGWYKPSVIAHHPHPSYTQLM